MTMHDLDAVLGLRVRDGKPRSRGLTAVIDPGIGTEALADLLGVCGPSIDYWKFGWGSAAVSANLDRKIALLREHGIGYWFGGTLFEIAYTHGRVEAFADWAEARGAHLFEISNGSIEIPALEKQRLIGRLSERFDVLSEVGSKDAEKIMPPSQWVAAIREDLDAGAVHVIAEGRESGAAGIYRQTGEVRVGLIQDISAAGIDFDRLIFEAPKKEQQVWFIRNFGRDTNLANIRPEDVVNLETLRLGLRNDTISMNAEGDAS